ncbi:ABC transporter substrate-binding protein [Cellulomonas sp. HZM]|uniref:ABC transporter substrate-binding protein n=1 Tax=Cellulomonas sp. HZM TaxID=1454010 RepID=UPI0005518BEB|nr:extracellular solute-binding protein [Cellulomonas sp. HZM]
MFHARHPRLAAAAAATAVVLTLTAACSSGSDDTSDDAATGGSTAGTPSGDILVLTNRTDLVDSKLKEYAATFEQKYPEVTVKFEALTDYEGEVKTRMSTKDYGDVLLIPNSVSAADYKDFFEPLGKTDELAQKYHFTGEAAFDGITYGMATFGNANGMVYNKDVFTKAGITDLPTTPEQLISDLQAVKDKTDAIPFYTNYKDGWPLTWPQNLMGAVSGDKDAGVKMAADDAPWTSGKEKYTLDSLLYDIAKAGLIEPDPTTTNWESSKNLIGTGKVAVMALGSWAVPQMQDAATKAGGSADSIGFMPAPFQVDGKFTSPIAGDYKNAININSKHKAAARAWIDWFTADSGFYDFAGGLPTVIGQPAPATLKDFEATGVQYLEMTPEPKLTLIDNQAEIGLSQPDYYRQLVDSARGALKQSKDQIFEGLNKKWAAAHFLFRPSKIWSLLCLSAPRAESTSWR